MWKYKTFAPPTGTGVGGGTNPLPKVYFGAYQTETGLFKGGDVTSPRKPDAGTTKKVVQHKVVSSESYDAISARIKEAAGQTMGQKKSGEGAPEDAQRYIHITVRNPNNPYPFTGVRLNSFTNATRERVEEELRQRLRVMVQPGTQKQARLQANQSKTGASSSKSTKDSPGEQEAEAGGAAPLAEPKKLSGWYDKVKIEYDPPRTIKDGKLLSALTYVRAGHGRSAEAEFVVESKGEDARMTTDGDSLKRRREGDEGNEEAEGSGKKSKPS